jgi:tetratricopeptide (TPR) repeat protein
MLTTAHTRLKFYWARIQGAFGSGRSSDSADSPGSETAIAATLSQAGSALAYDEALLDRARTQWQFGDWESLAAITHERVQHHPDRAKLGLLAAAGLQQLGRTDEAEKLIRQALDWGCSPRLVRQILVSGLHNTLARANAIIGQEKEAMKNFEAAIDTGTPNADRLVKAARATFQLNQIGVPMRSQVRWEAQSGGAISSGHTDLRQAHR